MKVLSDQNSRFNDDDDDDDDDDDELFCGMVDRTKAFDLISSRVYCQRSSPSRIIDTPRAGFELVQTLSSGLVECICASVIITTHLHHGATSRCFSRDVAVQNSLNEKQSITRCSVCL